MARIQSYRQLTVWQRAMNLVEECYRISARLPACERFGLVQQVRRAAVSIPSNIAEGFNRRSRAAYLNHLSIAVGSQAELATQLELVGRLSLRPVEETVAAQDLAAEVGRLLHGLIRALEATGP
ncbi:MAG: four helix bundle protein [Acidobacteriota bacterium]|nr:four helix bundle protein [Acidobacteriota bacterium]